MPRSSHPGVHRQPPLGHQGCGSQLPRAGLDAAERAYRKRPDHRRYGDAATPRQRGRHRRPALTQVTADRQADVARAGSSDPATARAVPSLPPPAVVNITLQDGLQRPPWPRDPMIVNDQDEPRTATPKICAMYLLPPCAIGGSLVNQMTRYLPATGCCTLNV
jgi:hypothetical protein